MIFVVAFSLLQCTNGDEEEAAPAGNPFDFADSGNHYFTTKTKYGYQF